MSFRSFIEKLDAESALRRIRKPVSRELSAAGLLKALEQEVILLDDVEGFDYRVAGNVFGQKDMIAKYFGVTVEELIPKVMHAIDNPTDPERVETGPCQEVVLEGEDVDLDRIPMLFHCAQDGGNFISSGVVACSHPEFGQNMDYHRAMQVGKNRLALRIVGGRHFDAFLKDQKKMDIAICIGNAPNVMLAGAISVDKGDEELRIANSLEPLNVVKCKTSDLLVPADAEFVLEGTIDIDDRVDEGPFVDLTETLDVVRKEPVMTVKCITHRKDAIWQALLPGGLEHKILMGMPREPTIFRKVNQAGVKCINVSINPGGCSWLHTIIQIDKQKEDDGMTALKAAFDGHGSLKHAYVVDTDIDIFDPLAVEWAMATRFQMDRDLYRRGREPGSSLDPSAEPGTKLTEKVGFDLTMPLSAKGDPKFARIAFPKVNVADFLE